MLRDNLVELIEPMLNSAGANPLALTHHQIQASGDRLPCLENPRPKGAESSLTENVPSPFQAEPAQLATQDAKIWDSHCHLGKFPYTGDGFHPIRFRNSDLQAWLHIHSICDVGAVDISAKSPVVTGKEAFRQDCSAHLGYCHIHYACWPTDRLLIV